MNNNYARFLNTIFYYLGVIVCCMGIWIATDMRRPTRFILIVFLIIAGIMPGFLLDANILDLYKYKRFYLVVYVIISFTMYFTWKSITMFICMLFLESMLALVYMDEDFHLLQNFVIITAKASSL